MMKERAPVSKVEGIAAVAALFGLIAAGVAIVLYDFGMIGGLFVGGIIAVIVGVVLALGWREPAALSSAVKTETAAAPAAPAPKAEAAPAPAPQTGDDSGKPVLLSVAREGGPDDLKQIKGVGPKLEKTLHDMGIFHFDQIAAWGPAEAAWIDDNLEGFKGRATRDDWVAQAKILAAGGTTEFSGKVKKGGVY